LRPTPRSTLFPYTTLFRSREPPKSDFQIRTLPKVLRVEFYDPISYRRSNTLAGSDLAFKDSSQFDVRAALGIGGASRIIAIAPRSEEHTSELQSRENLVCR